ncbi:MAG: hypothetical protein KDI74_12335 [Gammaproteobacteria bacterium]|nr:hypothetical protein [Gammaproteobacteria bacterium]
MLIFTVLLPLTLPEATADTLLMESAENAPASGNNGVRRPGRGESMESVRRAFGEPDSILPAVGDPPITRWVYQRFTVYFEYHLVITSVINR